MDFGTQIKKLRNAKHLTQEQLSQKLNVSRQTISSWENNRNLPDLEMVVRISQIFQMSLDQLILGDPTMADKLVKDGSEMRRAKISLYIMIIMVVTGVACFLLSSMIGSYIDNNGILHEPFFLIPIGYLFLLAGLVSGLVHLISRFRSKRA